MAAIEEHFSGVEFYELFTGSKSVKNITFYQKLGYVISRQVRVNEKLELVYLVKTNSRMQRMPNYSGI